MIYSSLAVLALSASAMSNPLTNFVHLHPRHAQPDTRVSITLKNTSSSFRDLKIGSKTYTVLAYDSLDIKAPAGTVIYTESRTPVLKAGDAVVELTPELNNKKITIN